MDAIFLALGDATRHFQWMKNWLHRPCLYFYGLDNWQLCALVAALLFLCFGGMYYVAAVVGAVKAFWPLILLVAVPQLFEAAFRVRPAPIVRDTPQSLSEWLDVPPQALQDDLHEPPRN